MKAPLQLTLTMILSCFLGSLPTVALGQDDGGNSLIAAEAFLDDPDQPEGTGTPLQLLGDPSQPWREARETLDLNGQAAGLHSLYVRFQDAHGDWSAPIGQSFHLPEGSQGDGGNQGGANRIQTAEAFIDTDPGMGAGFPIAIPLDGALDTSAEALRGWVDMRALEAGVHTLYVRFKDTAGVWSEPLGQSVYVTPALIGNAGSNRLIAAEYQIDGGPFRNAPLEDSELGGIQALVAVVEPVDTGYHSARVRFQDSSGHWSDGETTPVIDPDDLDGDGLDDAFEQTWFGGLGQNADDDPDQDGLTNLQELQQGTDPLTPNNLATPTLSGFVRDSGGERLADIALCVSVPVSDCATRTDAFGHYVLGTTVILGAGDFTLAPQSADWIFTPNSRNVTIATASIAGLDFVAEPPPPVTLPEASIDSIVPANPAVGDPVSFVGSADQEVELYHWSAVRLIDGVPETAILEIGSTPEFVTDILPAGDWRIRLQVRNSDKVWSEPTTQDLRVLDDGGLADLAINPDSLRFLDRDGNLVVNPQQGDQVEIQVEVQNLGMVDTPDEVTLSLYDGDASTGVRIATTQVSAIPAGGSITLEVPWQVGHDASGLPISGYEDDYKIITVAADFTTNLSAAAQSQIQTLALTNAVTMAMRSSASLVAKAAETAVVVPEVTQRNNQASAAVRVGLPTGSYGILLSASSTQLPYTGGTVTIHGRAQYSWGQQLPVMGARVSVRLDTGESLASTFTVAPNGLYVARIQVPANPGRYRLTVNVFDQNLYGTTFLNLDARNVPTPEEWENENPATDERPLPPPAPAPTKDLVVSAIEFPGTSLFHPTLETDAVVLNTSLQVTATVRNRGNLPVDSGVTLSFYDGNPQSGGLLLATETVAQGLPGYGSVQVDCPVPWDLTSLGSRSLYVVVDEPDLVDEQNEYNNTRQRSIQVRENLPDLRPGSLSLSGSLVVGKPLNLSADVYNNGPADLEASTPFAVAFLLDGREIGRATQAAALGKGDKTTVSVPWTPTTAGSGILVVAVDPDNAVAEDIETNNWASKSFGIIPETASIAPVDLVLTPSAARPQTQVAIRTIIQNSGAADATGVPVEFFVGDPDADGALIGTETIDVIHGQTSRADIGLDWITPEATGTYRIYVRAGGRTEYSVFSVTNTPPPDLEVYSADLRIDPAFPTAGDTLTLSANVHNGGATATDFRVRFTLDTPVGTQSLGDPVLVPVLAGGATLTVSAPETIRLTQPYYALLVEILPNPEQGDANYRNNAATRSFAGTGGEPISVLFESADPDRRAYGPGSEVTLYWSSTGLSTAEPMILSMKRASAGELPPANNPNWYRFTTSAANDGVKGLKVRLPAGLAEADDWTFCVGSASGAVYDCSDWTFSYAPTVEPTNPVVSSAVMDASTYEPGETAKVTWSATDDVGVDHIGLYLEVPGESEYTIAVSLENTGSHAFTIPAGYVSESAKVKVVAFDAAGKAGYKLTDTFSISENNVVPLKAVITGPSEVEVGKLVTLSGSSSTGAIQSFEWTQVSGTSVSLSGTSAETLVFSAPSQVQTLVFELKVRGIDGSSESTRVTVDVFLPSSTDVRVHIHVDDAPPGLAVNKMPGDIIYLVAQAMNWGSSPQRGDLTITYPSEWRLIGYKKLEVAVRECAGCAEHQVNHESSPGQVVIQDIEIPDLSSGINGLDTAGISKEYVVKLAIPSSLTRPIQRSGDVSVNLDASSGYSFINQEASSSVKMLGEGESDTMIVTNRNLLYKYYAADPETNTDNANVDQSLKTLYEIAEKRNGRVLYVDWWDNHRSQIQDFGQLPACTGIKDWKRGSVSYVTSELANIVPSCIDEYTHWWARQMRGSDWKKEDVYLLLVGDDIVIPYFRKYVDITANKEINDPKYLESRFYGPTTDLEIAARKGYYLTDIRYSDTSDASWKEWKVDSMFAGRIMTGKDSSGLREVLESTYQDASDEAMIEGTHALVTAGEPKSGEGWGSSNLFEEAPQYTEDRLIERGYDVTTVIDGNWSDIGSSLAAELSKADSKLAYWFYYGHGNNMAFSSEICDGENISFNKSKPLSVLLTCFAGLADVAPDKQRNNHFLYNMASRGSNTIIAATTLTKHTYNACLGESISWYITRPESTSVALAFGNALNYCSTWESAKADQSYGLYGAPWKKINPNRLENFYAKSPQTNNYGSEHEIDFSLNAQSFSSPSVTSSISDTVTRHFEDSIASWDLETITGFDLVQIYNYRNLMAGQLTQPIVPMRSLELALPADATVLDVRVSRCEAISLGALNIPVFYDFPTTEGIEHPEPLQEAPDSIGLFDTAYESREVEIGGNNVLIVDIYPLVYDTVTDQATLYQQWTLEVDYTTEQKGVVSAAQPTRAGYDMDTPIEVSVVVDNVTASPQVFTLDAELISDDSNTVVNSDTQTIVVNPAEPVEGLLSMGAPAVGGYRVEVEVSDDEGQIIGHESNHLQISAGTLTDLYDIEIEPGTQVSIPVTFQSKSNQESVALFELAIDQGSARLIDFAPVIEKLPAGAARTADFAWEVPANFPAGDYTLTATVTVDGSRNTKTAQVTVMSEIPTNITLGDYAQLSRRRVTTFDYEYVYRVTAENQGGAATGVSAVLQPPYPEGMTLIDAVLDLGDMPAGASTNDTFSFRQDRRFPLRIEDLNWSFSWD